MGRHAYIAHTKVVCGSSYMYYVHFIYVHMCWSDGCAAWPRTCRCAVYILSLIPQTLSHSFRQKTLVLNVYSFVFTYYLCMWLFWLIAINPLQFDHRQSRVHRALPSGRTVLVPLLCVSGTLHWRVLSSSSLGARRVFGPGGDRRLVAFLLGQARL